MEMEGGWAHPPTLATLGKMALGASVGFLSIGQFDYSTFTLRRWSKVDNEL